ncbi:MAG: hypothetical protein IJB83_05625 [Bacilli bacterium]|nr:hypothetical protein [Bacilli bacterium]
MLDSIIEKMRLNKLSYNEEYNIEELVDTIKKHLKNNIDILQKSYEYEYKQSLNIDKLISSFDYIKNNKIGIIDSPFRNEFGKVANNYVPYGIVGVIVKNDISLYNYASILNLLIQTNNSVILEPYKNMGTVNILIEMLNQVIPQINGINKIIINSTNELLQQNNNIDLLLFIGSKNEFNNIQIQCDKKYYGIGNYELIIDKMLDPNLIDEARKRNVVIIEKNNTKDFYNKFNISSSNYCTAIMSDNKEEVRRFISNVKSSYLLVNIIPTIQDEINIDIDDLLYKKSTLIWDDNNK